MNTAIFIVLPCVKNIIKESDRGAGETIRNTASRNKDRKAILGYKCLGYK